MRKVLRSQFRIFLAIAVAYVVVAPCAGWSGVVLLAGTTTGNYDWQGDPPDIGERMIELPRQMTYPVSTIPGADAALPLFVQVTMAAVFWAALVTSVVWIIRTIHRRLHNP